MSIRNVIAAATLAAATLTGASAANAASGQATTAVHVRAGAGTSYSIVDVLSAGEDVTVNRCTGGWCQIDHPGPDGWVSSSYLDVSRTSNPPPANSAPSYGRTARATTAVNVRSGAGTRYRAVDALRTGERVRVNRCRSGWCEISHTGPDGWVSARYLSGVSGNRRPAPGNQARNGQPGVGFCVDAPNFQFGVNCNPGAGNDHRRHRDHGGHAHNGHDGRNGHNGRGSRNRQARVCFYEDYNFKGASFCARPGDRDPSLSKRWNDRISSIRVRGGAVAVVCQDFNFNGRCAHVRKSIRRIGSRNNDVLSSYRITR